MKIKKETILDDIQGLLDDRQDDIYSVVNESISTHIKKGKLLSIDRQVLCKIGILMDRSMNMGDVEKRIRIWGMSH